MAGKTILIVDDEAPIREMIAVALEMAGYDCVEAENTQQAHASIIDKQPDLILLDWMLPGTTGIELARRLKRNELTADIPIIMRKTTRSRDWKSVPTTTSPNPFLPASWWPASRPCCAAPVRPTVMRPLR